MLELLRILDLIEAHQLLPEPLVRNLLVLGAGPEFFHLAIHVPAFLIFVRFGDFVLQVEVFHDLSEDFLALWALREPFLGNADDSCEFCVESIRSSNFLLHLLLSVQAALNRLADTALLLRELVGVQVTQAKHTAFLLISLLYLDALEDSISLLPFQQLINHGMVEAARQLGVLFCLFLVLDCNRFIMFLLSRG